MGQKQSSLVEAELREEKNLAQKIQLTRHFCSNVTSCSISKDCEEELLVAEPLSVFPPEDDDDDEMGGGVKKKQTLHIKTKYALSQFDSDASNVTFSQTQGNRFVSSVSPSCTKTPHALAVIEISKTQEKKQQQKQEGEEEIPAETTSSREFPFEMNAIAFLFGPISDVTGVVLRHDRVFAVSLDRKLFIFDVLTSSKLLEIEYIHKGYATGISMQSDDFFVTCSVIKDVKVWKFAETEKEVLVQQAKSGSIIIPSKARHVAVSHHCRLVAVAGEDATVSFFLVGDGSGEQNDRSLTPLSAGPVKTWKDSGNAQQKVATIMDMKFHDQDVLLAVSLQSTRGAEMAEEKMLFFDTILSTTSTTANSKRFGKICFRFDPPRGIKSFEMKYHNLFTVSSSIQEGVNSYYLGLAIGKLFLSHARMIVFQIERFSQGRTKEMMHLWTARVLVGKFLC